MARHRPIRHTFWEIQMPNYSTLEKAKRLYEEHSDFWSAELIGELENRLRGLAFQWANDCFIRFCGEIPDKYAHLQDTAAELAQETVDTDALMTTAKSIEHNRDDSVCLALAHLFMARICLVTQDRHYRNHVIHTMRLLGDHDLFRQSALSFPLRRAEELLSASMS